MFHDCLADFTSRLKRGVVTNKLSVDVPYTKLNFKLLNLLTSNGCIHGFIIKKNYLSSTLVLMVKLKYFYTRPIIVDLRQISKFGYRVYWNFSDLTIRFKELNFLGFYIISTSTGFCTSSELMLHNILIKHHVGEVLLRVSF